jgi:SAM-dependent methyltransferase
MNRDFDDLSPTERFSSRVEDYVRLRPGYSATLLPLLTKQLAFSPQMRIADVGSGTGLLTEHFLRNGNFVFGVEPNPPMRARGRTFSCCLSALYQHRCHRRIHHTSARQR